MAKTKAELESDREAYNALLSAAREAEAACDFLRAISISVSSWKHVDGMMRFRARYEGAEFETVETIELVLKYAPMLLDVESLDECERLLKSQRRIDREASDDLGAALADARKTMYRAYRLWMILERNGTARRADFDAAAPTRPEICDAALRIWRDAGLLDNRATGSGTVSLSTRLSIETTAKCPSCAASVRAVKSHLLSEQECPKCRCKVMFVLLS